MRMEMIEWVDSHDISTKEWLDIEEIKEELNRHVIVRTLGFLVAEDNDSVLVSSTFGQHEGGKQACHSFKIPKPCIRKRQALRCGDKIQ